MKKIYFFNGWAMDENVIAHLLNTDKYSIEIINYPYDVNKEKILENDENIFIAWSFGVYYLNKFLNENREIRKIKSIAINGIPQFIGNYGINPKMLNLTLNTLNLENLEKFYENMDIDETFKKSSKTLQFIKDELEYFKKNYTAYYEDSIDYYFISKNDRIIPVAKQKKYCIAKGKEFSLIDGGHYPFSYFKDFKDIVRLDK